MKIVRGADPGPVAKYGDYKPHLQPLFQSRCAYCISHEDVMGGYDTMEVDHFRPRQRPEFKHLEKEWANLYYACRRCNLHKWNHWPTPDEETRGLRFIDPCEDDPDDHVRIVPHPENGWLCWLRALTPAGRYTIDKIRLNRKQLVDIRRALIRQEHETQEALNRNRQQIELLARDVDARGATAAVEEVLCSLREEAERIRCRMDCLRSRHPFPVKNPTA